MIWVKRSMFVRGAWFVIWPWELRGNRNGTVLIVSLGRREVVIRRGR